MGAAPATAAAALAILVLMTLRLGQKLLLICGKEGRLKLHGAHNKRARGGRRAHGKHLKVQHEALVQ